jgi:multiple sugar transport system ATP-binding protein
MADVQLDRVGKEFPDGTRAVADLSLGVADGELLVLLGPSGSGKSTVLRLLAGLESPTSGRILLGGEDVTERSPQRRNVAMVFQSYALYPHKTVRGNLEFPLRMLGMGSGEIADRVRRAAGLLGLGELLDRRPRQLSGGQAQRVAMGRAIVRDPALFLMDEPLSNLDAALRVQIRGEIAALQERLGTTTVYVTHDQVEAMTLGNRVAVLLAGHLLQVAPPQELYDRPASTFVAAFVGRPPMNLFPVEVGGGDGDAALRFAGQRLPLPAGSPARKLVADLGGRAAVAGLRPEALGWAGDGDPRPRIEVELAAVEMLGHEEILYFTSPAVSSPEGGSSVGLLAARVGVGRRPETGDRVELAVDTHALHLFGADGRRLGP